MRNISISICALLALLFSGILNKLAAQYTPSKWEVGLQIGTLIYQGDLSANTLGYAKELKPAIGISLTHALTPEFALRGTITRGAVQGDDAAVKNKPYKQARMFAFHTPVTELAAAVTYSPLGNTGSRLLPYITSGIGVSMLNIRRDWSRNQQYQDITSRGTTGNMPELARDTMTATPRLLPVLPIGAGLRYQLSDSWAISSELNYRFTPSDYLDGFSYSANPKTKDSYYGISVGISYRPFSSFYDCPRVY